MTEDDDNMALESEFTVTQRTFDRRIEPKDRISDVSDPDKSFNKNVEAINSGLGDQEFVLGSLPNHVKESVRETISTHPDRDASEQNRKGGASDRLRPLEVDMKKVEAVRGSFQHQLTMGDILKSTEKIEETM